MLDWEKLSIEAMLVTKRENIRFLSGFDGSAGCLLLLPQEQILLTDFRYQEQAAAQAPHCRLIIVEGDYPREIAKCCNGLGRIGFEAEAMSYAQWQQFAKMLSPAELVPQKQCIEKKRMYKTKEEMEKIAQASNIAQQAFAALLPQIREGVCERDLALELDTQMRRAGAEGVSFPTIAVAGANSSLVHGQPGDYLVKAGDFILFDFGCVWEGYCSDMTRTVALGNPDPQQRKIYEILQSAQMAALEAAQIGVPLRRIDDAARQIIEQAGFGKQFGHAVGHGVGLEVHELPRVSSRSEDVLEEGMVITVEPGIYVEGFCGVRIEDLLVVCDGQVKNLCLSTSKQLFCL